MTYFYSAPRNLQVARFAQKEIFTISVRYLFKVSCRVKEKLGQVWALTCTHARPTDGSTSEQSNAAFK
jgi:hypothetical protein